MPAVSPCGNRLPLSTSIACTVAFLHWLIVLLEGYFSIGMVSAGDDRGGDPKAAAQEGASNAKPGTFTSSTQKDSGTESTTEKVGGAARNQSPLPGGRAGEGRPKA